MQYLHCLSHRWAGGSKDCVRQKTHNVIQAICCRGVTGRGPALKADRRSTAAGSKAKGGAARTKTSTHTTAWGLRGQLWARAASPAVPLNYYLGSGRRVGHLSSTTLPDAIHKKGSASEPITLPDNRLWAIAMYLSMSIDRTPAQAPCLAASNVPLSIPEGWNVMRP